MDQADIAALMEGIAPVMRGFVEASFRPLAERIAALEKRIEGDLPALIELRQDLEKGAAEMMEGIPGQIEKLVDAAISGESACITTIVKREVVALHADDEAAMRHVAREEAGKLIGTLPKPADGKSVTIEEVRPLVADVVASAMATLPVPKDGESVDPAVVKAMVDEVVAALPKPRDGKDADPEVLATMVRDAAAALMTPMQTAIDAAIADVRTVTEAATADMKTAIAELPGIPTAAEVAALIPAPAAGKDADPEVIKTAVAEAVAALSPAKDGENATPEQISAAVEKVLATWPKPKDGASVTIEDLRPVIAKALAELPAPKDGVGLAGALVDHDGVLVLTLTDGTVVKLTRVVGKDGEPGKDGMGWDDAGFVHDGARGFAFKLERGTEIKEFPFTVPIVLDAGVFKEGTAYEPGDGVTFGGSFWIARAATKDRPGTSDAWRLSVKKGRDGKDSVATEPKSPTPVKLK